MSESWPVTRIRAEFAVSSEVRDLVNAFLEYPKSDIRMHTTAQRIVETARYREGRYDQAIRRAEARLARPIARRALTLSGPVLIQPGETTVSLLFNTPDQVSLAAITQALDEIPSLDRKVYDSALTAEIARTALREPAGLREAKDQLIEAMRQAGHISPLRVGHVHISTTDIPSFPVEDTLFPYH